MKPGNHFDRLKVESRRLSSAMGQLDSRTCTSPHRGVVAQVAFDRLRVLKPEKHLIGSELKAGAFQAPWVNCIRANWHIPPPRSPRACTAASRRTRCCSASPPGRDARRIMPIEYVWSFWVLWRCFWVLWRHLEHAMLGALTVFLGTFASTGASVIWGRFPRWGSAR